MEPLVIIAPEDYPVALVARDNVVAERVVVYPPDTPVGTSEIDRHPRDLGFQGGGEGRVLVLRLELNGYVGVVVGADPRREHRDLVKHREVVLHGFHNLVELVHRTAFKHTRTDVQLLLLRLTVEVEPVQGAVKQGERGSGVLVDLDPARLVRLPRHELVQRLSGPTGRGLLFFRERFRQGAERKAERRDE